MYPRIFIYLCSTIWEYIMQDWKIYPHGGTQKNDVTPRSVIRTYYIILRALAMTTVNPGRVWETGSVSDAQNGPVFTNTHNQTVDEETLGINKRQAARLTVHVIPLTLHK